MVSPLEHVAKDTLRQAFDAIFSARPIDLASAGAGGDPDPSPAIQEA